ncbi:MAG: VCBS repeat-containing protein [Planctomycetes bacterium]|nr:VCBS repeat-containing protein [Planctomycetota bacterium]
MRRIAGTTAKAGWPGRTFCANSWGSNSRMQRVSERLGWIFALYVVFAVLNQGGPPGIADKAVSQVGELGFTEHLIAGKYGYTFGIAVADLDGDGDLDLTNVDIVGKNPSAASLLWFENDGRGSFQRHVIHDREDGWFERHAIGDINGDQLPDVAVVDNRNGRLLWFAHPGRAITARWTRHVISLNCPHAYDVVLCDFDGDGDLDAASAGYVSNTVAWYENLGDDGLEREWLRHVIDTTLVENRTIRLGDFNRDGRIDLLAASVGVSFSAAGETAKPEEHGGGVVWFENPARPREQPWPRHVIDDRSRGAIHGHAVDFDRDGDLDVVMAFGMRPEHVPEHRHEIVWYENLGPPADAAWHRHVIGALPCAFETVATDLDGDGDPDLAATAWSKGDRVVWFERPRHPDQPWPLHPLRENFFAANQIVAADLDGDGRPDLIATADDGSRRVAGSNELRWWRNNGGPK